jgi:hypothetical protein
MNEPGACGNAGPVAAPQGHVEGVEDELGPLADGGRPADNRPGEHVHDEGDVDDAGPGGDTGEVGDPPLVRTGCGEVASEQVRGPLMAVVADSGADLLPASGTLRTEVTHQRGDRAADHGDVLAVQLPPDLPHSVDIEVVGMGTADLRLQLRAADRARTGAWFPAA